MLKPYRLDRCKLEVYPIGLQSASPALVENASYNRYPTESVPRMPAPDEDLAH